MTYEIITHEYDVVVVGGGGAGLRAAEQVAALQHDRNGLGLDGRGGGVAVFADRAQQGLGEAEGVEGHGVP